MHERCGVNPTPVFCAMLAVCLAASCRSASAPGPEPGVASTDPRPGPSAPGPNLVRPAASSLAVPGATGSASVRTPARVAETVDVGLYEFRVDSARRCEGAPKPLLFATVHVNSKQHDLFVAPRDLRLEKDGVIFASVPNEKAPRGCGTPLEPVQLRPNGNANGAVYFELPSDVSPRGAKLVFKPTRWGGAPPVTVDLPEQI
jgi:hypothetical protein